MNAPRVTTSNLSPFGRELRKVRVDHSMRLYDVAKALGMTPSFISAIEIGRKPIPPYLIDLLQSKLGLTTSEVQRLIRAADLSKSSFVIDAETPESRVLAGTVSRKIKSLTPEKIAQILRLFEYSTKRERDRYRQDQFVRGRSLRDIRNESLLLRANFNFSLSQKFRN
jgi:transcriptional regulator with XRE-family HTH domain